MNTRIKQNFLISIIPAIMVGISIVIGAHLISKSIEDAPISFFHYKIKYCSDTVSGINKQQSKQDTIKLCMLKSIGLR